jgi:chromate reductase
MTETIRIVGINGSLRAKSYNQAALRVAKEMVPEDIAFETISIGDLPFYNEDLEADLPAVVQNFRQQIQQADAVFIVSPEYNGSLTGVLKNALDWASRPHGKSPFIGKPVTTMGIGGRSGTAKAQAHTREILRRLRATVIEQPEAHISFQSGMFDEENNIIDAEVQQKIRTLLQELVQTVENSRQAVAA